LGVLVDDLKKAGEFENTIIAISGDHGAPGFPHENIEPPADLKFEEPDVRVAKTVKDVMAKHQNVETCYRCHSRIDPLRLALERYDPIGRLRKEYRHVEVVSNANTIA
jgi:arylsulfatase A-like enzyme